MNLSNEDISSFSNNGFLLKKNILKETEIHTLKKIVKSTKEGKGAAGIDYPVKLKAYLIKLAKFDLKKIFNTIYLHKINNKLKLNLSADKLFNESSKLNKIDGYYNSIAKKEILPWHCDQAYSGVESVDNLVTQEYYYIKFFFYLTDVGPENGCTSYIPGSHKITYAFRTCLFNREIEYKPHWTINDFLNLILEKDNYKKILNRLESKTLLEDFIKKANLVINKDNNSFDFKAEPGDLLLFNDGGFHRGSKPTLNERSIVRYMYLKNSQN